MMKKFLCIAAAIAVSTANAFTTTSVTYSITTHTSTPTPTTTQLYSVEDMRQRIKKAGGGISTIVAGDLSCYDPNENGKLQGSGDLETRLSSGASFPGKTSTAVAADPPAAATPAASRGNGSRKSGTTNLTNLLNVQREEEEFRPRKDLYGGKSQC